MRFPVFYEGVIHKSQLIIDQHCCHSDPMMRLEHFHFYWGGISGVYEFIFRMLFWKCLSHFHMYSVYIMASKSRVIYVGVTNNLIRRVSEHQNKLHPESFTAKYHCKRLVYYEEFQDVYVAIAREKELKGWKRAKKSALIETSNPFWDALQIL